MMVVEGTVEVTVLAEMLRNSEQKGVAFWIFRTSTITTTASH